LVESAGSARAFLLRDAGRGEDFCRDAPRKKMIPAQWPGGVVSSLSKRRLDHNIE
jgi:hypothetical protein